MRKIVVIIILAVVFLLGYKQKVKPKIAEKDLLKIHISNKRSK